MNTFDLPNVIKCIDRSGVVEATGTDYGVRTKPRFTLSGSGLTDAEERLARSTCAHEAAHHLVADFYGLAPHSWLAGPGEGVCHFQPGTPDENEAVSWAGLLGEDFLGARNPRRKVPAEALSPSPAEALRVYGWADDIRASLRRGDVKETGLSWEDLQCVESYSRGSQPARAHKILADRLDELKAMAATLFDTFKDAIIQAKDLSRETVVQSAVRSSKEDDDTPRRSFYGDSVDRMQEVSATAGETEREAARLSREAAAFSRQLERLGELAESQNHFECALEHILAFTASEKAAEAAEAFNAGWAKEFCELRAAGDPAGARRAAYNVELRTPRYLKRLADEHKEKAILHKQQSGMEVDEL